MRRSRVALGAVACALFACGTSDHGTPQSQPPIPVPMDPTPPPKGPQPDFGATRHLDDSPPPISGGTLTMLSDGRAAAADPDRDRVYLVELDKGAVTTLPLMAHDEPGRMIEDDAHRLHVVLRRAGAVVTIDLAEGAIVARRNVCPAPRGIDYDEATARLYIACETGEIVAMEPAPTTVPYVIARIDRDLRDVVVSGNGFLWVSRFRNSELLAVSMLGAVTDRRILATPGPPSLPTLAWRMIRPPAGGTGAADAPNTPTVLHQDATMTPVSPTPSGYDHTGKAPQGAPVPSCEHGIVSGTIALGGGGFTGLPRQAVLPVDFARDGDEFVVVAAGNGHTRELPRLFAVQSGTDGCEPPKTFDVEGQPTAVSVVSPGRYLVQSREPAELQIVPDGTIIPLAPESREDTGHAVFHSNSGIGIACASCHGEGGDDAHVWQFDGLGARRTPSLRGTLDGTAPYHWNGDMRDISMLADQVLSGRMNGPSLADDQKGALQSWLFALPPPAAPVLLDPDGAARGEALFNGAAGCIGCHVGPRLTTSATVDVGTNGKFQVPSLIGVSARAPFLHDGCAATLIERFGPCGGTSHGDTSNLTDADKNSLVAYLWTL